MLLLIDSTPDEISMLPRRFVVDVQATLDTLQNQEDTDGNMQITIEDSGPKVSLSKEGRINRQMLTLYKGLVSRHGRIKWFQ